MRSFIFAFAIGASVALGCSSGDEGETGEDNIESASSACSSLIEDRSGEGRSAQSLVDGDDPIARLIFQRAKTACPTTLRAVVDSLREAGCGKDGMAADFVSERAVLIGRPDAARTVLIPKCEGVKAEQLLLAPVSPVQTTGPVPTSVEIIAMSDSGAFNFYAVTGTKWQFFGDSRSMVMKGPGANSERKCAACHNSGGLVMKELLTPWTNWDARSNSGQLYGIEQIRENLAQNLGMPGKLEPFSQPLNSRRFELEPTVRAGNKVWNEKRLAHILESGTVKDLLKPIFCTNEINLRYFSSFDDVAYAAAVKKAGQQMLDGSGRPIMMTVRREDNGQPPYMDTAGQPLEDKDGNPFTLSADGTLLDPTNKAVTDRKVAMVPAVDTPAPDVQVVRADIDDEYEKLLIAQNAVSVELVNAIWRVDVTRGVFSDQRCALVAGLPDVDIKTADGRAARIEAAITSTLTSKSQRSAAESEFLESLTKPEVAGARETAFFTACDERRAGKTGEKPEDVAFDFLKMESQTRNRLRKLPIAEAPELLPFDALNVDDKARPDLKTCKFTK